ncbi:MAG: TRAP transporter small permease [Azospirillaceae bacterium]
MPSPIDRLADRVSAILQILGVALLSLLVIGVGAQVIFRYFFGVTPQWSEEVGRYLLIHTTLMGAAVSVHTREHIRLDIIVKALPALLQVLIDRANRLIALGLFGLLTWYGIETVDFMWGQRSQGLRIPLAWSFMGLPVYFGLAFLFALLGLVRGRRA